MARDQVLGITRLKQVYERMLGEKAPTAELKDLALAIVKEEERRDQLLQERRERRAAARPKKAPRRESLSELAEQGRIVNYSPPAAA